jgi:hypothetical protein
VSVQLIACPDCAFRLPYAILGRQGSYRTGREFVGLCKHLPAGGAEGADALTCPVLRAEAERVLKVQFPGREGNSEPRLPPE